MADRWLTYAELAELMGCPIGAARARAVRRRWRRQIGNDGLARVLVPDGEDLSPKWTPTVRPNDSGTTPEDDSPPSTQTTPPSPSQDGELLARLDRLQAEMTEMAQRLGASEAETKAAREVLDELRQDRDAWRAQAKRLLGDSETMHERMIKAECDRDQALERLNHNIDRLDRIQAEHHTEITIVRDQLARTESERNRAVEALAAHLALPWWRRLLG